MHFPLTIIGTSDVGRLGNSSIKLVSSVFQERLKIKANDKKMRDIILSYIWQKIPTKKLLWIKVELNIKKYDIVIAEMLHS